MTEQYPNKGFDSSEEPPADLPMQPVPLTLYRRVTRGVRIAAWRQHEESRFRYVLAACTMGFVVVFAATIALVIVTNMTDLVQNGISGGMGWLDYYATAFSMTVSAYTGAYSLVAAGMLAMGSLILGLLPLSRFLKGH